MPVEQSRMNPCSNGSRRKSRKQPDSPPWRISVGRVRPWPTSKLSRPLSRGVRPITAQWSCGSSCLRLVSSQPSHIQVASCRSCRETMCENSSFTISASSNNCAPMWSCSSRCSALRAAFPGSPRHCVNRSTRSTTSHCRGSMNAPNHDPKAPTSSTIAPAIPSRGDCPRHSMRWPVLWERRERGALWPSL